MLRTTRCLSCLFLILTSVGCARCVRPASNDNPIAAIRLERGMGREEILAAVHRLYPVAEFSSFATRKLEPPYEILRVAPSDLDLDGLHLLVQFDNNGRAMNYGGVIEIRRVFDEDYQVPASEEEWQRWRSSGIQIGDDLSRIGMFSPRCSWRSGYQVLARK